MVHASADKNEFQVPGNVVFRVSNRFEYHTVLSRSAYFYHVSAVDHMSSSSVSNRVMISKAPRTFHDPRDAYLLLRSLKAMHFFDHPNLLRLLHMEDAPNPNDLEDVYWVTELLPTDMSKTVRSKQELSLDHVRFFMWQLLRAIAHIHSAGVIHMCVNSMSILLTADCDLKLSNFNHIRQENQPVGMEEDLEFNRFNRAPEVMCGATPSKAVDLWGAGCVMGELLLRKPVFYGADYIAMLQDIVKLVGLPSQEDLSGFNDRVIRYFQSLKVPPKKPFSETFTTASPEALDLLDRLLQFNPANRITAEEALKHPLFADFSDDDNPGFIPCPQPFDWEEDTRLEASLNVADLRMAFFEEMKHFNPWMRGDEGDQ